METIVKIELCPCDWIQRESDDIVELYRVRGSGPCDQHSDDVELLIRINKHPHWEPPC